MSKCEKCVYRDSDNKISIYKKNETIFFEGDEVDNIYFIKEGIVKLSRLYPSGDERVIDIVKHGDFLALLTVLKNNKEYFVTATTITSVVLEVIPMQKANCQFNTNLEFKETCINCATNRIGVFQNQMFNFSSHESNDLVLNVLTHLYNKFGYYKDKRHFLKLPISKTDLASMAGLRRETFSRKLSELNNRKIIKVEKNIIEFLNM
ncbi:Crp/Fnr family transcriptional regulator [Candidatus Izimaplasma bacterium ZiA1]|uniref:Crp/Fnr family transcriptional regulator n=1 Tax=Candidatus Izimoplasma sp. ZiA1 TaxID=2024899 RepID=UPI00143B18BA